MLSFSLLYVTKINASNKFNYSRYNKTLKKYLNKSGMLDYKNLKNNSKIFDLFIKQILNLKKNDYNKFTKKEKLAFWLNTYNALTIKIILNNFPLKSIMDLKDPFNKIKFRVLGSHVSLNNIENNIIRKYFKEPRIHMALVCAAIGCPTLRNEPFIAKKLDFQLKNQTKKFLSSKKNFKIDKNKNIIYVSSIFKWYSTDFIIKNKSLEESLMIFISKYIDKKQLKVLNTLVKIKFKVKYLYYNWKLNQQ